MMSFFASTAVSYGLSARARWFALLLMTIFCGLSGVSASAMAESATQTVSATNTSQVRQLTTELAQLIAHYRQADDSEQANLLNEIQSITEQRQALLLELVAVAPAEVLHNALPAQALLVNIYMTTIPCQLMMRG